MTRKNYEIVGRDGRIVDDDDPVLRDGETLRVPLHMRDGSTVDLEPWVHASRLGLDDGLALHRPGPRYCTDEAGVDAKAQAYADGVREMCDAWKTPARPPAGPGNANDREVARMHDTGDAVRDAYLDQVADMTSAWERRR
jgi:hypothetical protein